ncbi:YraN family protein [Parendozoicomonas sp. Alg238-R29]|uniref:YraN family protein n=1 Tax=Parendozoicomonas sp. Alg238-R29 TaxID=2993446 RepID=UPI00248F1672|nr:YraN family protein [Parendozoicomonas sp. Alg238-R29]
MFWKTKVKNQTGKAAEDLALTYLQSNGLKLCERNYACKTGELDLIMKDGDTLVFVEVRFRQSQNFGSAAESVDYRKQLRLNRTAEHYLQTFNLTDKQPCRFDIISIQPDANRGRNHQVDWIRNAFGP